jgi:integrase
MPIYKRDNIWWVDVTIGGKRVRRSAHTGIRREAQQLHDQLKSDSWRQEQLGEKPKRSFDEAALKWLKEKRHKKSIKSDAQRIVFWRGVCRGMTLDGITRQWVSDHMDKLKTVRGTDASAGTKNRYVALLRAILRTAEREWEWIARAPSLRTYRELKGRAALFTPEQARRLLAVLPAHWKAPVAFAFLTGLRRSNVFGLRWDQVDLERSVAWVHADQAKGGRNIVVPLNTEARALLEHLPRSSDRVFGSAHGLDTRTWRKFLRLADCPQTLRFHDIRHTFASWHLMAGTDPKTLQQLGGWATPAMLERYVHLTEEHLARAQDRLRLA